MTKLYIFDLDGTLYEETDHFDYYAKLLMALVPEQDQQCYWEDYLAMKQGEHVVSIGKVYDVKRDLTVTIDPLTLTATAAHTWDGKAVEQVGDLYGGQPLSFDFNALVAIGDGWWLPFACAKHYGVDDTQPSYHQTKAYMVTDRFQLNEIAGLRQFLLTLKITDRIVLMTNSDRADVERLLTELNLVGVFDHIITSARKPEKTMWYFNHLQNFYQVPFEKMISIGDNFINEIAPALMLGMEGIYLSRHDQVGGHKNLTQYASIRDLYK
ncbi:putative hydrolase of the HAD superfamily [Amphibacillus marinus]|uniref:Putative hydrolase of the HAD superfamily n=1 Tax=Amphibacillus marinus TaxID=872970 RepID=A0A1H8S6R7_9BACI|nr:HAD family hydrolase [Amphibacillus marinus]SEO74104.1 putative hydrolase of the HAD superfamily [Amphibacillus marinus]